MSKQPEAVAPHPFKLLSRKELLAILPGGVSWPTAWDWIKQGILPEPIEIGGRVGFKDIEVFAAIDKLPRRKPKGSKVAER
jgi:predicted DNA-binding transcriptional regulator AlpA